MGCKLFIICGHGAGDPGACAGGQTEAALVRKLAARLKDLGGSDVQVGDMSVNWYDTNGIGASAPDTPSAPSAPSTTGKLYRVQLGAFSIKSNAEKFASELRSKGYKPIITHY